MYAFNTQDATYKVNGSADILDGSATLTLTATTIEIFVNDVKVKTYEYTRADVANAVVNVTAPEGYTGDLYVYTYGGDRVGADFNQMTANGDGTYTYIINGSAHVIFTTTNDWTTAVKFIISDASGVLPNQEPLVSSGETVNYTLSLS